MRRPAGVTVAALVLGLMALWGLLVMAASFAGMFLLHNPAMPQTAAVHRLIACFYAIFACFFIFCLWTVVDLFRLRRWARYSVVVIGILTFILAGGISAVILVVRHFVPAAPTGTISPAQWSLISTLFIAFSAFYAVIALIGLWWAVYFNLKHVRGAFAGSSAMVEGQTVPAGATAVETQYGPWQVLVIAIACLMLFGALMMLGLASLRMPVFLFGIIVQGKNAIVVDLVFAAIGLFAGIGMLMKFWPAYWTAIGWQIFGAINLALFLIPGYAARALAAGSEVSRPFTLPPQMNQPAMLHLQREIITLSGALGLPLTLFFLYALLRCRRWYLGGGSAVDTA